MNNNYLFDRCVRVTLMSNVATGGKSIEYAPLYNPDYTSRIDAQVTDQMPKSKSYRPGYTAEIKLYNVSNEIKATLAGNGAWLTSLFRDDMTDFERQDVIEKYYNNRLQAEIEVGYFNRDTGAPDYKSIFKGFINNTYTYRMGSDDITTVECYNFDEQKINWEGGVTKATYNQTMAVDDHFAIGDPNWSNTFIAAIERFEDEKANRGNIGIIQADAVSKTTYAAMVRFKPKYKEYISAKKGSLRLGQDFLIAYKVKPDIDSLDNDTLQLALTGGIGSDANDTSNFQSGSKNVEEILNKLCKEATPKVSWLKTIKVMNGLPYVVYVIYGAEPKGIGAYSDADWKVVNYQNVISTPMITTSGALSCTLLLDPRIRAGDSIGFYMDKTKWGAEFGESGGSFSNFGYSLAVSGQTASSVPTVLGANAFNIYSQEKMSGDSSATGFIFNKSFPIIKCIYDVSTHAKNWSITVNTVPVIQGLWK